MNHWTAGALHHQSTHQTTDPLDVDYWKATWDLHDLNKSLESSSQYSSPDS
jgi:hypothetical protein